MIGHDLGNLSEPVFLRNLIIIPIRENGNSGNGLNVSTIDDIIRSKKGNISELDAPTVDEVIFNNEGDEPVLMLDGEEITGAMQNRIIAVSDLVEAKSAQSVPVVCVEEKRWDEIGGFRTGYCSYPRIRAILAQSRYKKIDKQQVIWQEIDRKLTVTKTASKTSSMHDIYENLQDEVDRYLEGFENLNHHTIGIIGAAGSKILGCDLFQSPEIYRKFEKKLIRSYALDAIEYQRARGARPEAHGFFKAVTDGLDRKKSRNRIVHKRIKGKGFLGQALVYNNNMLHLSAFPYSASSLYSGNQISDAFKNPR